MWAAKIFYKLEHVLTVQDTVQNEEKFILKSYDLIGQLG